MDRKTARELVRDKASNLYHGSALNLLATLVNTAFTDSGQRPTLRVSGPILMRRIGVSTRQLGRVLSKFESDGLGNFTRKDDKVIFRLDLSPLEALPVRNEKTAKSDKADRAERARTVYAGLREARKYATFTRMYFEHLEADNHYTDGQEIVYQTMHANTLATTNMEAVTA